uniref:Uncharacterized protein n=1 Tax=Romanomermis culicivorax TaxID=13658 RepID=A0A915IKQ3_ROMCU
MGCLFKFVQIYSMKLGNGILREQVSTFFTNKICQFEDSCFFKRKLKAQRGINQELNISCDQLVVKTNKGGECDFGALYAGCIFSHPLNIILFITRDLLKSF